MTPPRGCRAELQKIDEAITDLGGAAALDPPSDAGRVIQYVYCLYQKASIAGDLAAFDQVERAIERAVPLLSRPGDLFLLKANVAFKLHRLADAEAALTADRYVRSSIEGRLLRADLDFQRGRYRRARHAYCEILEVERTSAALARLAHLVGKMGDVLGADRLYEDAQDELTAKELRSFAWLEVQRGFLDFAHGRFSAARSHYQRADKAYPGYWLIDEHLAELLGAEERYEEAIAMLVPLTSSGSRPDLEQAIGELHNLAGQNGQAEEWFARALAAYQRSAERGEICFWHHLADFYAEVAENGPKAVAWARKDVEVRENFWTQAALAGALFCDGRFGEARDWADRAISSGAVDARLFSQAGRIYGATGDTAAGQVWLDRAMSLNPMIGRFHMHH
jgi:tetratricopeptide (TPR) repeat protein